MSAPRIVPTGVLGGINGKDGSNVLPTDTAIKQAIQDPASQTAAALTASTADLVQGDGPTPLSRVSIQGDTARPAAVLDNDPNGNARIHGVVGGNILQIANFASDTGACSAIYFVDGSTGEHGGLGREVAAIGYSISPDNGVFGGKAFLEVSNDPFIGDPTNPPKDWILVQTGYIAPAGYGPKVRMAMDGAGHVVFNDVMGVGQLHIGPTGGHVDVLTKLNVGSNAAVDLGIEIHQPTAASGLRIHDTTTDRSTYLVNGGGFFTVNATGGNGVKLSADGLDAFQSKGGKIGVFGQVGTARAAVNSRASDLSTTTELVNQIRDALVAYGWLQ